MAKFIFFGKLFIANGFNKLKVKNIVSKKSSISDSGGKLRIILYFLASYISAFVCIFFKYLLFSPFFLIAISSFKEVYTSIGPIWLELSLHMGILRDYLLPRLSSQSFVIGECSLFLPYFLSNMLDDDCTFGRVLLGCWFFLHFECCTSFYFNKYDLSIL